MQSAGRAGRAEKMWAYVKTPCMSSGAAAGSGASSVGAAGSGAGTSATSDKISANFKAFWGENPSSIAEKIRKWALEKVSDTDTDKDKIQKALKKASIQITVPPDITLAQLNGMIAKPSTAKPEDTAVWLARMTARQVHDLMEVLKETDVNTTTRTDKLAKLRAIMHADRPSIEIGPPSKKVFLSKHALPAADDLIRILKELFAVEIDAREIKGTDRFDKVLRESIQNAKALSTKIAEALGVNT